MRQSFVGPHVNKNVRSFKATKDTANQTALAKNKSGFLYRNYLICVVIKMWFGGDTKHGQNGKPNPFYNAKAANETHIPNKF